MVAPTVGENEDQGENGEEATIREDDVVCEDVQPMRRAPRPYQPTRQEVEDHNETHYPYRSWCKFCNEGKGTGEQHGRGRGSVGSSIPIIAVDYFYITAGGDVHKKADLEKLGYASGADGDAKLFEHRKEGSIVKCI